MADSPARTGHCSAGHPRAQALSRGRSAELESPQSPTSPRSLSLKDNDLNSTHIYPREQHLL